MEKTKGSELLPRIYVMAFLSSLGSGSATFMVPVFALTLGASYVDLGAIGATQNLFFLGLALFGGYLSDKMNTVHLVALGLGLRAVSFGLLTISTSVYQLIALAAVGGAGMAFFFPTSETLVSRIASGPLRVYILGRLYMYMAAGMLSGPLLGGYLAETFGFKNLFTISALLLGVSTATAFPWMSSSYAQEPKSNSSLREGVKIIARNLWPLAVINLPFGAIIGILFHIFPGYARNLGSSPSLIGILFIIFGFSRIGGALGAKRVSVGGDKASVIIPAIIITVAHLLLIFNATTLGIALALVGIGFSSGILFPVTLNLATRLQIPGGIGITIGAYESIQGSGSAIGPIIAGPLAQYVWVTAPFALSALFGLVLVVAGLKWSKSYSFTET